MKISKAAGSRGSRATCAKYVPSSVHTKMPQIASSSRLPHPEMKDSTAAQRYETFTGEALQHQLIEYMWRSRIGDSCPDMKPERLLCAYKAESVSPRQKIKFKPTFMEGKEEPRRRRRR